MNLRKLLIIPISIFLLYFSNTDEENIIAARKIAKDFGLKLKAELMQGMKNGGPESAIEVCNKKAPQIAKQISDSSEWKIGRTSLKPRNSSNKPDKWEITVLENFEIELKNGKDIKGLEYSEIVEDDGIRYFRYMRAIPTGAVCLNCHGSNLNENVQQKIDELYKDDKAINYKKGEIRGAFTLSKMLK